MAAKMPASGQAGPEAEAVLGGEQGVAVGADGVERDVAEVEQAGEADDDVQAPAQHDVGEDHDAEVEIVAAGESGQQDGDQEQRRHQEPAGSLHRFRQPTVGRHRLALRPLQHAAEQHDHEDGDHEHGDHGRPPVQHQAIGTGLHAQADQRDQQPGGDDRRDQGTAQGAHTFSTSARPSSPLGMTISTRISTAKAATSLYWAEP